MHEADLGSLFTATATAAALAVLAVWVLSLLLRDASIVDIYWGPGFTVIGLTAYLVGEGGDPGRRALIVGLTALWSARLGLYLLWRARQHGEEDPRYQAMRRRWGPRFPLISLATVFSFQALLMWIVSLPVQVTQVAGDAPLGPLDLLGAALFFAGFLFEAVGDAQLARFRADPASAGQVMDRGLWRYTRHPNYFGNALLWWGLFAIALGTPYGPYTIVSPLLMTFLLLRVSGVALLERSIGKRRPAYAAYVERTSAFVPMPPKS